MKLTLMNAISLDGFIATDDGDSDWVVDDDDFDSAVKEHGCILIGRKTYEQYEGEIYPVAGITNFVLTNNTEDFLEDNSETLHFLSGTPQEVLAAISEMGFNSVLLGGGAETNAQFAKASLIDNVILDIHPIMLGHGKTLLGDYDGGLALSDSNYVDRGKYVHFTAKVNSKA